MATISALYRYPVKSMLGEILDAATLDASGVAGDRTFAVVDATDGRVASAKHPRKWGRLLEASARLVEGTAAGDAPVVRITLPDGTETGSDDPAVNDALSAFLGRDVSLVSVPPAGATFEEVWPAIDGLAPGEFIASTRSGEEEGQAVSSIGLAMAAPPGRFFDLAPLHLLTTATLAELRRLEPAADFDVARYRPNVVIETDDVGFVENSWAGGTTIGLGAAAVNVILATMRCVMTTLPQGPSLGGGALGQDRSTLQAIARHNRIELPGMGEWACAGTYAGVAAGGVVRVGDPVTV